MYRTNTNRGITIIELLLVISVVAIISATAVPISSNMLIRNYHRDSRDELISQLFTARINAITNKENTDWGVNTTAHQITLFKGVNYASRDTNFDKTFETPNSITVSTSEIVFQQNTGNVDSPPSFNVSSTLGDSYSISINQVGNIDVN